MSDNMDEFAHVDLEDQLIQVRNKYRAESLKHEFEAFMGKIDRLTHEQRVELFNALAVRLAGG